MIEFVHHDESPGRLDVLLLNYLAADPEFAEVTRSQIKHWIEQGLVQLDGVTAVKAGHTVKPGQCVCARMPEPALPDVTPHEMPLDILYEDELLIALNKPAGLSMHPGAGAAGPTLVSGVSWHLRSAPELPPRCGLVHRLDKDTTGVVLIAKTAGAQAALSRQFAERSTEKIYLALVFTTQRSKRPVQLQESGSLTTAIGRHPRKRTLMTVLPSGGREAVTEWRRVEELPYATLLELRPKTGRTHQLRVHMQHLKSPIMGDPVYGEGISLPAELRNAASAFGRQALHAQQITVAHPGSGAPFTVRAPLPHDYEDLLQVFRNFRG